MEGFEIDFIDDHGFIVKDNNEAPSCGCGGGEHGGGSCCG
jgi:hypothetical protein